MKSTESTPFPISGLAKNNYSYLMYKLKLLTNYSLSDTVEKINNGMAKILYGCGHHDLDTVS